MQKFKIISFTVLFVFILNLNSNLFSENETQNTNINQNQQQNLPQQQKTFWQKHKVAITTFSAIATSLVASAIAIKLKTGGKKSSENILEQNKIECQKKVAADETIYLTFSGDKALSRDEERARIEAKLAKDLEARLAKKKEQEEKSAIENDNSEAEEILQVLIPEISGAGRAEFIKRYIDLAQKNKGNIPAGNVQEFYSLTYNIFTLAEEIKNKDTARIEEEKKAREELKK